MKARQFSYTAYGLGIRSSLALPELEAGDGTADAVVRRGKLAARPAPATGLEMSAHVTAERARFSWPDVGTFLVADGTRIIADAAPCVPESVLRLYVLGPALATLLRQRGLLVLHASAVSIAGEAVAFLGGPGWGKSTAAAALHARGHAVVADDVIAVAPAAGGPVVLPGFPWLKLWPDVSRAIGEVPERLPRVHPGLEKRELRVPRGFSQAPLPLRCLYVLGEGETLEAEPLTRQQALVELLRHSYGARALHGVKTDSHFRQSAAVAGRVPVRRLRNRRSLATLTDVARLIEGDLAQPSADGSAEAELLLSCARTRRDAAHAKAMAALIERGIDLDRVVRMAGPHGLLPLLYWHLGAIGPGVVSSAMLSRLREHFEANARRNLSLTAELLKIVRLLEASDIAAVPFKGPLLAVSTYGNLSLRQFADLDILVRRDDVLKAKELLIACGYRPQLALTGAQEAAFLRSHSEYVFSSRDGKVVVELQWRFAPAYFAVALDLDRLWDRLQWVSLGGVRVRSLGPEDLLLVLCVHGSKHCWERLEWICGIAEVVRTHQTLDWPATIEEAGRQGSVRMLFLGLLLANQLLGAPIPEDVLRRARSDSGARVLAGEVRARLFRGTQRVPGMFATTWFHLRARERLADRSRYCLRLVSTPTAGDFELVSLPARLSFLYYVLRPIRLARKYGLIPLASRALTRAG